MCVRAAGIGTGKYLVDFVRRRTGVAHELKCKVARNIRLGRRGIGEIPLPSEYQNGYLFYYCYVGSVVSVRTRITSWYNEVYEKIMLRLLDGSEQHNKFLN